MDLSDLKIKKKKNKKSGLKPTNSFVQLFVTLEKFRQNTA